jgi:hypothetical protein
VQEKACGYLSFFKFEHIKTRMASGNDPAMPSSLAYFESKPFLFDSPIIPTNHNPPSLPIPIDNKAAVTYLQTINQPPDPNV